MMRHARNFGYYLVHASDDRPYLRHATSVSNVVKNFEKNNPGLNVLSVSEPNSGKMLFVRVAE